MLALLIIALSVLLPLSADPATAVDQVEVLDSGTLALSTGQVRVLPGWWLQDLLPFGALKIRESGGSCLTKAVRQARVRRDA